MNIISLALFTRRSDAEPFQRRLSEAGVPAWVQDHASLKGGAQIDISADQFEKAHQLMLNWDATEGGLPGAIRCPECRSLRVEYPQYTHKSALPNLLVGVLANIGAMHKEFYCHDCHFTWPKEGTKPSRTGPNMAPYYFIDGVAQTEKPETRHAA